MLSKIGMMGTLTIKNAPTSYAHSQASNSQAANGVGVSITSKNQNAAQEAKSAEIDNKANISEHFAEKMLERCRREMEKRPLSDRNMENAKILADSLVTTAKEIERYYGKEQANSFMSQVLSVTDQKVDENLLAGAVKTFFETVKVEGLNAQQRKGFSGILNRGCESLVGYEDDGFATGNAEEQGAAEEDMPSSLGSGNYGLAYGMNLFFGTVTETECKDFDLDYNWVTLSSEPIDLTTGNNVTASEFSKSEEAESMADYLLNQIGSEEASDYIKNLLSGSNFMDAVATAVAIVAEEKGQSAAQEYVAYLNHNLKNPIDNSLSEVTFHGWRLPGVQNIQSNEPNEPNEPSESLADLWFFSSEVEKKGHLGLINKFTDKETGVGIYKTLDLHELYMGYKKSQNVEKESGIQDMNQSTGNLVDTIV